MPRPLRYLISFVILIYNPILSNAQIGVATGQANSLLSCIATAADTPELRPEGYTELAGDIVISCTGGPLFQLGAAIPTTNIVVYMAPAVPITSRFLDPSGTSEAMLIIDEAGSNITTGVTGDYGPNAPQTLCTTAQQQHAGGSACPAFVGPALGVDVYGIPTDYEVAVTAPNGTAPAANVYQGKIGDFGVNSVTFYNVPVLPPATSGVTRTFRITNIRVPVPGGNLTGTLQAIISTSPNQVLPVAGTAINIGVVGPALKATVNAAPTGGGNPFPTCVPQTTPALAARVTFTEGFATSFKTRVVAGGAAEGNPPNAIGNTTWAAEAQNLAAPSNQNIPGGLYGGFAANNESGLILPALAFTDTTSNITYTAGLADFGTRLKAVFSFIPAGVTVYVSTTSTSSVTVPGGTSVTPYAVLVAAGQATEATGDGTAFAPLTSTTVGSDGLFAYPLTTDNLGTTAAIWEVVNSNPSAYDSLTFSVYIAYSNTLGTNAQPTNVALSFAPEPGGGSFPTTNATQGLTNPSPRFAVISAQEAPFATISYCELSASNMPLPFNYTIGGTNPPSQTVATTVTPSNLPVTVTPIVTTPSGGSWLSASLTGGTLTVSVNPSGLAVSATAYTGNVKLSTSGVSDVLIPVTLTVDQPPPALTIVKSHSGNFAAGQIGATYSITVSNAANAGPTNAAVSVTENPPPAMTITSMTSTGTTWTCTATGCTTNTSLPAGASYPQITVAANISPNASSPTTNIAAVSGGGSSATFTYDDGATITPLACNITGGPRTGVADVQQFLKQALGIVPPAIDLTGDGSVNIADIEIVVGAVVNGNCVH